MSSSGVEPGLSRPRRDVLTTRRWGHNMARKHGKHSFGEHARCRAVANPVTRNRTRDHLIKLGGPVGAPSRHLHGFGAFFANVSCVLRFGFGFAAFVRVSVSPSVRAPPRQPSAFPNWNLELGIHPEAHAQVRFPLSAFPLGCIHLARIELATFSM